MRRYGMLLLVLVLATASLLAAAAYNSATVTNAASMRIVNTKEALLALMPAGGSGNDDKTVEIDDKGRLVFKFEQGREGKPFGVQPNSVYVWENLFKVKNNTTENLNLTVKVTDDLEKYVEVKIEGTNKFSGPEDMRGLGPSGEKHVSVRITCDDKAKLAKLSGTIVVEATTK